MDESSHLYQPILTPEDSVRKYRYNPFLRGRYIRELKELICNNQLPQEITPELLSVINDCLFPRDIEAILTQHTRQPCLLAEIIVREISLKEYPSIKKIAEKYKNGSIFLHAFLQHVDKNLSEHDLQIAFMRFQTWRVDFNARDAKGNTALHIAAQRGLDVAVKVLVEKFGAVPELSNNALETPRVAGDIMLSPLHVAIERRDVEYFRLQLNEHNINREHPILGTPMEHLGYLTNRYAREKKWHSPRQWWRNYKLKKMLEMCEAKTRSSNDLLVQRDASDEQELGALNLSSGDVFRKVKKADNYSEEWVLDLFKKDAAVIDQLLTRCLHTDRGWQALFSTAMNPKLALDAAQREYLLEKVLAELDCRADRAESTSKLIKDFSALYQSAQEIEGNRVLLEKVFEVIKPSKLIEKMGNYAKFLMSSPQPRK